MSNVLSISTLTPKVSAWPSTFHTGRMHAAGETGTFIFYCVVTKPHLGKVCIFLPILFKGKLIHYICVIPILLCCYHTFHLGLKFEFKHSL